MEAINKLRDLTSKLPEWGSPGVVKYPLEQSGDCVAKDLLFRPSVSVCDAHMEVGLLGRHIHKSVEVLVCYSGEMTVITPDGNQVLHPGGVAIIPPGVPHEVRAHKPTWMVGVCVPSEEAYPRG